MVNEIEELKAIKEAEERSRKQIADEELKCRDAINAAKKDREEKLKSLTAKMAIERNEKVISLKTEMDKIREKEIKKTKAETSAMKFKGTDDELYEYATERLKEIIRE
jgi:vacuolar-type H+-ATPase subunit H